MLLQRTVLISHKKKAEHLEKPNLNIIIVILVETRKNNVDLLKKIDAQCHLKSSLSTLPFNFFICKEQE